MAMKINVAVNDSVVLHCEASSNGSLHIGDTIKESEEPNVDFLNDFDSLVEDIEGRLTISRMVSDSVIKGMVNAVEQEAANRIAQNELELASLKKRMNPYCVHLDENKPLKSIMKHYDPTNGKACILSTSSDALFEQVSFQEPLSCLKNAAKEQFKNIRMEIDKIRGHSSMRRINSGSELVGLGGILQGDDTGEWIGMNKMLDSLRITMDTVIEQVYNIIYLSRTSFSQWQLEQKYQEEVEDMVVASCIRSLKEQFEERLWDQNVQCLDNENINWIEKFNEISSLRQELDVISKSLCNPETGLPNSYSFLEMNDDLVSNKRTDFLHRKISGNHVSTLGSLSEGNGKREELVITVPENLDAAQLKHMSKEELVNYFKTEMTKMKRNHDYKLQQITEDYFSLRRDYLNERSSLPSRRDKEFDVLRKKIPHVIVKLDKFLVENENFSSLSSNGETISNLKDRLESLLLENHQLRDLLSDRKKEVNRLSSQVSDAMAKMSKYSLSKDYLVKEVANLKAAIEDACIEAAISWDVYKCLIREVISEIKDISEDLEMGRSIMKEIYDIIFGDASCNISLANKIKIEDSDLESLIMEGLCEIIFKEGFLEAQEKLHCLSKDAFKKERILKLEVAEKEKLQQDLLLMTSLIDEKGKLLTETMAALSREKEKFMLASQELDMVRDQKNQQQTLISKCNEESRVLKNDLLQAMEKLELYTVETSELNQKLDQALKDLRESDEEKSRILVAAKEKEGILSYVEATENAHKKQMELVINLVEGLSKTVASFECQVTEAMKRGDLRLEKLSSQSSSLVQMANIIKRKELRYKRSLERRCSDLEKAENEVDLLGDEVDVLLGLLEKIYIALDHYSPILKHYPGIMEILKLVRRQLSGESTKLV